MKYVPPNMHNGLCISFLVLLVLFVIFSIFWIIWNGRFLSFGGAVPFRPVEDLAFAVARFFQRGGTFQNYYMVLQPEMFCTSSILYDSSTSGEKLFLGGISWYCVIFYCLLKNSTMEEPTLTEVPADLSLLQVMIMMHRLMSMVWLSFNLHTEYLLFML